MACQRQRVQSEFLRSVRLLCCAGLAVTFCSCQTTARLPVRGSTEQPQAGSARQAAVAQPQPANLVPASGPGGMAPSAYPVIPVAYHPAELPPGAWTGAPYVPGVPACPPPALAAGPDVGGAWQPPGISGTWPENEYLFDGGDKGAPAQVRQDWTIVGLDQEDTVAHYDTLSGRTETQASNRVQLYAPRFAAVRKVSGYSACEQKNRVAGVEAPTSLGAQEERLFASSLNQPLQPGRYLGTNGPQRFRDSVRSTGVNGVNVLAGLRNGFKPYENFKLIRDGKFDNSEKPRLTERLAAAVAWNGNQAVQAIIDDKRALVMSNQLDLQSVYHYETPPGKPRLRIVKVASQPQAKPGDIVEFTLRFDNVGDQLIGNVTIVDSLATRLEYVPDSAQCSLGARFVTQENDGESLTLRWEVADPLKVGQGGVIRFKCRVR